MFIHTEDKSLSHLVCRIQLANEDSLPKVNVTQFVDNSYSCEICGKMFEVQSALGMHMLIHNREKQYAGGYSQNSVVLKDSLQMQMFIQTGDTHYSSGTCGNPFTCKSDLTEHMLLHNGDNRHTNTQLGGKTYSCEICRKPFDLQSALGMHMLIHTRDKQYTDGCWQNSVTLKDSLKTQMVT